jgi:hypothetical protein
VSGAYLHSFMHGESVIQLQDKTPEDMDIFLETIIVE